MSATNQPADAAQNPTVPLPENEFAQLGLESPGGSPQGWPQSAPPMPPEPPASPRLSTFMKVSIAILTVVTLASIALLFVGDFEGKFERVFSTIALFAVFVLLTAFDTRRERRNEWYAPVALIANTYILGLLLIVIWVTRFDPFGLQWTILWKSLFVIVTTRCVMLGVELLLRLAEGRPSALGRWAQVTSLLGVLSLIMFTAPVGIEAFAVRVPDLYWKFAVATLILTALGLAITLLLRWYYQPTRTAKVVSGPDGYHTFVHGAAHPLPEQPLAQQAPQPQPTPAQQPVESFPQQPQPPQQALLPWPTYPDGTPFPVGADGQPDFAAAGYLPPVQP